MSIKQSIDWETCVKLAANNAELARELLDAFITHLPQTKVAIVDQAQRQDYAMLNDTIHKFHGSCCYCGVPNLKTYTCELEVLLKTQQTHLLQPLLDKTIYEIEQVLSFYDQQLRETNVV